MPNDPIVERLNLVEEENNYLKEKIKKNWGGEDDIGVACCGCRRWSQDQDDAMRLKIRKIRKYAIHTEAWYHYAVGSIVTLVAILITFVVALKCFT